MTSVQEPSAKKNSQGLVPWLMAARPKTLTSAVVPIAVGTVLAYVQGASIDWSIPFFALLTALFIQIGTNLVNDAIDFKKGADTTARLGPQRVTQSGLLSGKQVLKAGIFCFIFALAFGIPLMLKGGIPLIILLGISVLCGYFYTGGPYPLAYHGLGDLFVFLFFGLAAVGGVYYLQTETLNPAVLLAGCQIGLLDTVLIAINNLRDYPEDRKVGKFTLPARFGASFGRIEVSCLILGTYLVGLFWISLGYSAAAILPLGTFPLGIRIVRNVWNHEPSRLYNSFLAMASLLLVAFGVCLSIGLLM